ncbi:uncharacterized protein RAG0_04966 [Rhynchosporium agropyri]|uniref:Uncharacterized protein n=1 Tax=Rhynchosporium agropyri TaxID=914238 RepID=A0A1E1KAY9_9HELO|nr:uncharacterized protein RAG0_04966 [Rhynchosporium agropyri]
MWRISSALRKVILTHCSQGARNSQASRSCEKRPSSGFAVEEHSEHTSLPVLSRKFAGNSSSREGAINRLPFKIWSLDNIFRLNEKAGVSNSFQCGDVRPYFLVFENWD